MREYSPKRRTALVLSGAGTSGAYHAGVLKALDECGVKIDLVVGSGVGTIAAALLLLSASFGVFLLPLAVALVAGLLFPLVLIVDLLFPGLPSRILGQV